MPSAARWSPPYSASGLQPILETAFNLVTPSKLIELSNPNQPLLRRLMIETPGTYHHSMVVANLAEAAAEAVGANALLARVGAYYHDIGKLIRPMYFKENQMGENPHDKTDPRVSTAILTEHTRDGVEAGAQAPPARTDHRHDPPAPRRYARHVFLRQGGQNAGRRKCGYPRFPLRRPQAADRRSRDSDAQRHGGGGRALHVRADARRRFPR